MGVPNLRVGLVGVFRVVMGFYLGVMIFFTFGVAGVLFRAMPRAEAGEITTLLFPAYYIFLYSAALAGLAALWIAGGSARWGGAGFVLVAVAVIFLAAAQFGLAPAMDELRAEGAMDAFRRMHGVAMLLNLAAMVCAAGSLLVVGQRK